MNGVLFDLGVSSLQLDKPERGFSFMREGELDMRFDNSSGMSAKEWINSASEKELASSFSEALFIHSLADIPELLSNLISSSPSRIKLKPLSGLSN